MDEKYYKMQTNIYELLLRSYMDKYLFDSILKYKTKLLGKRPDGLENVDMALEHISVLVKSDMALRIWKGYFDGGKDACTVKSIKRYLFNTYHITPPVKDTDYIKKIEKPLRDARTNFIAHNLMDDDGRLPQISDLFKALEDIRKNFNSISLESIDWRVKPLEDAVVYKLCYCELLGFDLLLDELLEEDEENVLPK